MAKAHRIISLIFCVVLMLTACFNKQAVATEMTIISDAETQNYLAEITYPLFKAAGISFNRNNIFLINDNSLNAFVSDGNYLFINTGTLIAAQNTNELSGILAHETGHILGGHIVRQKLKLEKMQYVMLASVLAAGATAVSTGRGDAAAAIVLGSQSSVLNSMLHYQVQEERSADESAVKLLNKTGQSTKGLLNFMRKIKHYNALSGLEEDSYFRTHPLTTERISHFMEASKNNHYADKHPLDGQLKMIQAKLSGFLEDTSKVLRKYPLKSTSADAQYAQSIVFFRQGHIAQALQKIDSLIATQPNNPYFHELKGQFLFESGRVADSALSYEKALNLRPNNYLLQLNLAHALIEKKSATKAELQKAADLLQKSLLEVDTGFAWQLLARAKEMLGDKAYAYYATAEYNYSLDNLETAESYLKKALDLSKNKTLNYKIADLKERIKEDKKERGTIF